LPQGSGMLRPTVAAIPGGRLLVWINGPAPTVRSGYQAFSAKVVRVRAAYTSAPLAASAGLPPRARSTRDAVERFAAGTRRGREGSACGTGIDDRKGVVDTVGKKYAAAGRDDRAFVFAALTTAGCFSLPVQSKRR
jgi:hypothetical protein